MAYSLSISRVNGNAFSIFTQQRGFVCHRRALRIRPVVQFFALARFCSPSSFIHIKHKYHS